MERHPIKGNITVISAVFSVCNGKTLVCPPTQVAKTPHLTSPV